MLYHCSFHGRQLGAIGVCYAIALQVEADDAEGARLRCYDTHEHILRFVAVADDRLLTGDALTELVRAGVPYDHHESDLYLLDTPQAREILARHGLKGERFTSQIDGKAWLDVPFAYSPWWQDKQRMVKT